MTKWIKCSDSLPDVDVNVLISGKCGIFIGFKDRLVSPCWYTIPDQEYISGITHWAELPEAPHD